MGEIRDKETAELAMSATNTGHLVLSTLHTNDAASAINRLLDLGVHPSMVASAVTLAMAQRLLRRACPKCARPQAPGTEEKEIFLRYQLEPPEQVLKPEGCEYCDNTG